MSVALFKPGSVLVRTGVARVVLAVIVVVAVFVAVGVRKQEQALLILDVNARPV